MDESKIIMAYDTFHPRDYGYHQITSKMPFNVFSEINNTIGKTADASIAAAYGDLKFGGMMEMYKPMQSLQFAIYDLAKAHDSVTSKELLELIEATCKAHLEAVKQKEVELILFCRNNHIEHPWLLHNRLEIERLF